MRALGVDLGSKRVGLALCDSAGTLATPYETLQRSGDEELDHRRLAEHVAEVEAEVVVVGLPRSLDGSIGPAARSVIEETERMAAALDVPIETHDERLTTVTAEADLRRAGVKGRERRKVVDQVAAAVILQGWLDARSAATRHPGAG